MQGINLMGNIIMKDITLLRIFITIDQASDRIDIMIYILIVDSIGGIFIETRSG